MTRRIALVGEAWGEIEEQVKHAFVGSSGVELVKMLGEAGIITLSRSDWECIDAWWQHRDGNYTKLIWRAHEAEVALFNVFNLRPPGNDIEALCGSKRDDITNLPPLRMGKYFKKEHLHHVDKLYADLTALKPNLVVAFGNTPCWALLRRTAITRIRGAVAESAVIPGLKVLPCIHPAAILRQWDLRHATVLDLIKAKREREFPEIRRPKREIWIEPTLADLDTFYTRYIEGSPLISPDIETSGTQITCIGFSPYKDVSIVVPFFDPRKPGNNYWSSVTEERAAWQWVRKVLDLPTPKLFQNGLYDLHFLWRGRGIPVRNAIHDTMLMHHAMFPESPKGLGFLGSLYTDEAAWKVTMRDRSAKNMTLKRDDE